MTTQHEMPVSVRLTKQDLAKALNQPEDHEDIKNLGNVTVMFHSIAAGSHLESHPAVAAETNATKAIQQLSALLQPIEEKLFQVLRSNPAVAKDFLFDPVGTLEELGFLENEKTKEMIEHYAAEFKNMVIEKK